MWTFVPKMDHPGGAMWAKCKTPAGKQRFCARKRGQVWTFVPKMDHLGIPGFNPTSGNLRLASEMLVGPAADGGFAIEMQPGGWLYTVLQAGLLRWVDGVSVHPYRGDGCAPHLPPSFCKACAQSAAGCGPESALEDYSTLRGIIAKFAAAAGKVRARIFSPASTQQ